MSKNKYYCQCKDSEIEKGDDDNYYCLGCGKNILYEPDADLENDLRAELDEEARIENEVDERGNKEIGGHIEDKRGVDKHE